LSALTTYFSQSSAITIFVLLLLSAYFVATFWIFLDRFYILTSRIAAEAKSLKALYTGQSKSVAQNSLIFTYLSRVNKPNKAIMGVQLSMFFLFITFHEGHMIGSLHTGIESYIDSILTFLNSISSIYSSGSSP